jgi:hypothetical protein
MAPAHAADAVVRAAHRPAADGRSASCSCARAGGQRSARPDAIADRTAPKRAVRAGRRAPRLNNTSCRRTRAKLPLSPPMLLGLALHGRHIRVLHLEPVWGPSQTVRRILPLRDSLRSRQMVAPSPSQAGSRLDQQGSVAFRTSSGSRRRLSPRTPMPTRLSEWPATGRNLATRRQVGQYLESHSVIARPQSAASAERKWWSGNVGGPPC